jgi:hypothetical protein
MHGKFLLSSQPYDIKTEGAYREMSLLSGLRMVLEKYADV